MGAKKGKLTEAQWAALQKGQKKRKKNLAKGGKAPKKTALQEALPSWFNKTERIYYAKFESGRKYWEKQQQTAEEAYSYYLELLKTHRLGEWTQHEIAREGDKTNQLLLEIYEKEYAASHPRPDLRWMSRADRNYFTSNEFKTDIVKENLTPEKALEVIAALAQRFQIQEKVNQLLTWQVKALAQGIQGVKGEFKEIQTYTKEKGKRMAEAAAGELQWRAEKKFETRDATRRALKQTVERQHKDLIERNRTIKELQKQLAAREQEIIQLKERPPLKEIPKAVPQTPPQPKKPEPKQEQADELRQAKQVIYKYKEAYKFLSQKVLVKKLRAGGHLKEADIAEKELHQMAMKQGFLQTAGGRAQRRKEEEAIDIAKEAKATFGGENVRIRSFAHLTELQKRQSILRAKAFIQSKLMQFVDENGKPVLSQAQITKFLSQRVGERKDRASFEQYWGILNKVYGRLNKGLMAPKEQRFWIDLVREGKYKIGDEALVKLLNQQYMDWGIYREWVRPSSPIIIAKEIQEPDYDPTRRIAF